MRQDWGKKIAESYNLDFRYGFTRGLFIFDDFVIKFDINEGTNGRAEEFERYENAKLYEVERILLSIDKWYKSAKGVEFYIQPKCGSQLYDAEKDTYTFDYENLAGFMLKQGYCENKVMRLIEKMSYEIEEIEWVARAVQYYGWRFMRRVVAWFNEEYITDLHGANIGLVANYRSVIFDYAGVH